jgi:hypothetical protein
VVWLHANRPGLSNLSVRGWKRYDLCDEQVVGYAPAKGSFQNIKTNIYYFFTGVSDVLVSFFKVRQKSSNRSVSDKWDKDNGGFTAYSLMLRDCRFDDLLPQNKDFSNHFCWYPFPILVDTLQIW